MTPYRDYVSRLEAWANALHHALKGGNADKDNADLFEFLRDRLHFVHKDGVHEDYMLAARDRAGMIRSALHLERPQPPEDGASLPAVFVAGKIWAQWFRILPEAIQQALRMSHQVAFQEIAQPAIGALAQEHQEDTTDEHGIATAPKDGRWILLAGGTVEDEDVFTDWPTDQRPPAVVGRWEDQSEFAPGEGRWVFAHWDGAYRSVYHNPTRWWSLDLLAATEPKR